MAKIAEERSNKTIFIDKLKFLLVNIIPLSPYCFNNTIMVHIRKLRSKIEEDPQNPKIIRTVWGKGYTFG